MDFTKEINGDTLEYIDDTHTYIINGVIVPSITQILKLKFGGKYNGVNKEVLNRAAEKGTAVHEAIEAWCKHGTESDLPELRNFKFLQKQYEFDVLDNEVPVILYCGPQPISAGRLDLVLKMGDKIGGADIKRTSTLDKQYLAYQLNLYRIAYRQSYGVEWKFLKGIHLRENTRKFVDIPVNEEMAMDLVNQYMESAEK